MLLSICGSQGTGKSTLLNALKRNGYHVVQRKTSRSILAEWNVTLDQVNSTPNLCMKFQDEILERKFQDERRAVEEFGSVLTERTYVDLATYALISLGSQNGKSEWLNEYMTKCATYQKTYDSVIFLPNGKFPLVNDGVRGVNQHYSDLVDHTMARYHQLWTSCPQHTIESVSVDDRVAEFLLKTR